MVSQQTKVRFVQFLSVFFNGAGWELSVRNWGEKKHASEVQEVECFGRYSRDDVQQVVGARKTTA